MKTSRLEAFSDGVIAILITIMVLEFKTPAGHDWPDLLSLRAVFSVYVLSFVFLGIYWNNHHHMIHLSDRVTGAVLWANLHLLFWLSLFPFGTAWMGDSHLAPLPTALYGFILMMAGTAYYILKTTLIAAQGAHSSLAAALGSDFKGKISVVIYAVAIPLAYVNPWVSVAMYGSVAAMWLVPDRRIERHARSRIANP
ncbi:MAG TPA: TMEM175 family protein [Vicinamibacterales bacterium]|nr:TMEM175 family protein [Vicinamibacterales bacterium]